MDWLVPTIMGAQAIALALIGRLRWFPDEDGKCICLSGCTEGQLVSGESVDAHEYEVGGSKVLVISAKS